jgi:hypothetical protein
MKSRVCKKGVLGGIVSHTTDGRVVDHAELIKAKTMTHGSTLQVLTAPRVIDYLSIDIEGAEERALANFPFSEYLFNCVTIERPTQRLRELFRESGYILIKQIPGLDCFYIHSTLKVDYTRNLLSYDARKQLIVDMG